MEELPRRDGSYYVVKSMPDNKLLHYDSAGMDKYFYEEQPGEWNWEIGGAVKGILRYECIEATTEFHGRKWTAWFAPEIPVQNEPWKLGGLPGLILEACPEGGQYRFIATGIQQPAKPISPVYLANEYEKTNRMDFLREKRSFLNNPLGKINAQLNGEIKVMKTDGQDGSSLFASESVVDFIETDYK